MFSRKLIVGMILGAIIGFINPIGLLPANAESNSIPGYVHSQGDYPIHLQEMRYEAWKSYNAYLGNDGCFADYLDAFQGAIPVNELPKGLQKELKYLPGTADYEDGFVAPTIPESNVVFVFGAYHNTCNFH